MMASVISQYFASLVPRDAQHNPDSVKLTEFNTFITILYLLEVPSDMNMKRLQEFQQTSCSKLGF